MTDLFDLGDLPSWLQVPEVDTETATRVRRAANGWLQDATGLTTWPDPVPDQLWAWGLELAAIAMENPVGTAAVTVGSTTTQYGYTRQRRAEILEAAHAAAVRGDFPGSRFAQAKSPLFSFPEPDWSWK